MEENFVNKKSVMLKTSNNLVETCHKALSMVRNQKQELIEKMPNVNIEDILRCIYDELYYENLLKDICDINQTISQLTC